MMGIKLILVIILASYIEAANILVIVPFTSKSHYIMLRPLGLELARRGHNVTIITANREPDRPPNYHEVVVDDKEIWDVLGIERPVIFDMIDKTTEQFLNMILWNGGLGFTELALNSSRFKEFITKDNEFDLVISEQFFQEALNILAYKYKAPLALVSTFGNCMKHNLAVGNPLQINTVIYEYLKLKDSLSVWGRLRNIYITLYDYVWWKYWYLGKQEDLMRSYIPLEEPVPSLYEVQTSASLLLINNHFSFDTPMALLPNIVEIGGLHLSQSDTSLSKDIQEILDKSKHGVVYMSFGSNVRSSELPMEKRDAFLNVFSKLKQTVLWKWEDDKLENKADNIIIRNWFPQKEILAHPNVKVFISHGGLIGTQEAAYNGVPIIGVPVYADQYNNLLLAEEAGFGNIIEFHDINENTLYKILDEILKNDSYRINAKEMSQRFKDRPMTPLDTAVFWLEYVIRHKGADFMKSSARHMSWIKYFLLDISLILITALVAGILTVIFIAKMLKLFLFQFRIVKIKRS